MSSVKALQSTFLYNKTENKIDNIIFLFINIPRYVFIVWLLHHFFYF